ncbi:hypothetical protein WOA01_07585 [Methylocystis sp. IM2]|uniref:hypothetical protein n=1 Tax=Methylocystis sp. IM2 TaxID=3136563 RepID=UPI0030F74EE0
MAPRQPAEGRASAYLFARTLKFCPVARHGRLSTKRLRRRAKDPSRLAPTLPRPAGELGRG